MSGRKLKMEVSFQNHFRIPRHLANLFFEYLARNRGSLQRLNPKNKGRGLGNLSEMHSSLALSHDDGKRIVDGTNPRELLKAMSTYLNETGAGDYNLPVLLGERIADSNKKTNPDWSF